MKKEVYVTKADGVRELFDEGKLRTSLQRAGAEPNQIEQAIAHISSELEDGMTTDHIYRHTFSFLHRLENPRLLSRYSLRRALIALGPTGFPFEKYLGQLFKSKGYEIALNQMVRGACVEHEMDVVAFNESKLIMIESKFHNKLGEKSDLKVVLYIKARFDDLLEQTFEYGKRRQLDEGWLITNTKFTDRAIAYGKCASLRMVGCNYPDKGNLQDLIEDSGLHPITCLSKLPNYERELLLNNGVVLCKQVIESGDKLVSLGLPKSAADGLIAEAKMICSV